MGYPPLPCQKEMAGSLGDPLSEGFQTSVEAKPTAPGRTEGFPPGLQPRVLMWGDP